MNMLYITEDYIGSRVHHNLCEALANADNKLKITLLNIERPNYPLRDLRPTYTNINYELKQAQFKGNLLIYRTFFPYKIAQKLKLLHQNIDVKNTDLVVASTLFSDGAVALKLWEKFKIPYVVAVRGTDVNLYLQHMPHLYSLGRQIIANAKRVIFVSPSHMQQTLQSHVFCSIANILKQKSLLITNGIDQIWIDNQHFNTKNRMPNSVLYVGIFDRNKNVGRLIDACKKLKLTIPNLTLNLVGGGGDCEQEISSQMSDNQDWIKFHGAIYDKQKLIEIFRRNAVFAMVSHSETFGLVYLEALTQGLPIIYTENQGFDNVNNNLQVGYAANSNNVSDIAAKLEMALKNRENLLLDIQKIDFSAFSWQKKASDWLNAIKI